jgi:hypothetical protein
MLCCYDGSNCTSRLWKLKKFQYVNTNHSVHCHILSMLLHACICAYGMSVGGCAVVTGCGMTGQYQCRSCVLCMRGTGSNLILWALLVIFSDVCCRETCQRGARQAIDRHPHHNKHHLRRRHQLHWCAVNAIIF